MLVVHAGYGHEEPDVPGLFAASGGYPPGSTSSTSWLKGALSASGVRLEGEPADPGELLLYGLGATPCPPLRGLFR